MADHLTDEEQIAKLKDWWSSNGKPLITGGLIAIIGVLAWNTWKNHQTNQSHNASILYQELVQTALSSQNVELARVAVLADNLNKAAAGSYYDQYGQLVLARVAVDNNKLDDAASILQGVLKKPADATMGEIARLHLAQVQYAQNKGQEALATIEAGTIPKAYIAAHEELRGDILLSLNRPEDARVAYEKARDALSDNASLGALSMKLDDLAK